MRRYRCMHLDLSELEQALHGDCGNKLIWCGVGDSAWGDTGLKRVGDGAGGTVGWVERVEPISPSGEAGAGIR